MFSIFGKHSIINGSGIAVRSRSNTDRRSWRHLAGIAALAVVFLSCAAAAADVDIFDAQSISPEGKLILTLPVQFDGVGPSELVVLTRDELKGKRLLLYKELSPKNFQQVPGVSVELSPSVMAIQAIDIDNDHREEIVLLGLEAIYVVDFDDGGFAAKLKEVGKFDRLFSVPPPDDISEFAFMFDLESDNILEAVIPCWDGIRILKHDRTGFASIRSIAIEHRGASSMTCNLLQGRQQRDCAISLPTISVQDLNADRTRDILVASASGLAVCHQVGELQFGTTPNQVLLVKASFLEDLRFTSWGLADVNNDKVTDYCRVFTQGKTDEFRTVLEIFLGNAQLGYPQRPSKRIVLDQYGVGLMLADLDHDGSASVVLATISVSSTNLVKSLLMKRMGIDLNVFEAEGGVFAEQAKFVKKLNCAIDFFGNGSPTRYIGCLRGDLDRDHHCDLVSISDDDELEVYRGSVNPHFSDKPVAVRQSPRCHSVDSRDLNADGKSDLIVLGWDEDGHDQVTLLWAK